MSWVYVSRGVRVAIFVRGYRETGYIWQLVAPDDDTVCASDLFASKAACLDTLRLTQRHASARSSRSGAVQEQLRGGASAPPRHARGRAMTRSAWIDARATWASHCIAPLSCRGAENAVPPEINSQVSTTLRPRSSGSNRSNTLPPYRCAGVVLPRRMGQDLAWDGGVTSDLERVLLVGRDQALAESKGRRGASCKRLPQFAHVLWRTALEFGTATASL